MFRPNSFKSRHLRSPSTPRGWPSCSHARTYTTLTHQACVDHSHEVSFSPPSALKAWCLLLAYLITDHNVWPATQVHWADPASWRPIAPSAPRCVSRPYRLAEAPVPPRRCWLLLEQTKRYTSTRCCCVRSSSRTRPSPALAHDPCLRTGALPQAGIRGARVSARGDRGGIGELLWSAVSLCARVCVVCGVFAHVLVCFDHPASLRGASHHAPEQTNLCQDAFERADPKEPLHMSIRNFPDK